MCVCVARYKVQGRGCGLYIGTLWTSATMYVMPRCTLALLTSGAGAGDLVILCWVLLCRLSCVIVCRISHMDTRRRRWGCYVTRSSVYNGHSSGISYLRTLITTATVVSTLFVCWSALAGPPLASNSSSGDTKDIVEFLQTLLSTLHKCWPGQGWRWPPVRRWK